MFSRVQKNIRVFCNALQSKLIQLLPGEGLAKRLTTAEPASEVHEKPSADAGHLQEDGEEFSDESM